MLAFFSYSLGVMGHHSTPLFLALILFAGCSGDPGAGRSIPPDRFAEIYLDLLDQGEPGADTLSAPSPKALLILRKWGTTEAAYRRTLAEYNRDPESWREFFAMVTRRGEERAAQALEEQKSKIKDQR